MCSEVKVSLWTITLTHTSCIICMFLKAVEVTIEVVVSIEAIIYTKLTVTCIILIPAAARCGGRVQVYNILCSVWSLSPAIGAGPLAGTSAQGTAS